MATTFASGMLRPRMRGTPLSDVRQPPLKRSGPELYSLCEVNQFVYKRAKSQATQQHLNHKFRLCSLHRPR